MTIKEQILADAKELGYTVENVRGSLFRLRADSQKPILLNGIESLQYFVLNKQNQLR